MQTFGRPILPFGKPLGIPVSSGGGGVPPPSAPTLSTVAPTTTANLRLTITGIDPAATSLNIYRSTDNVSFSLLANVAAASPYNDATITAGTAYYYKVSAVNAGGESALSSAVGANTLTLNLESYWKVDEASGTAVDSVVATGNDLTAVNNPLGVTGLINNGRQFVSASTQKLTHADNASLRVNGVNFEFWLWFKFTTVTGLQVVLGKLLDFGSAANFDYLAWTNDTTLNVTFSDGASFVTIDAGVTLTTGTFYFISFGYNTATGKGFIQVNDGALVAVTAPSPLDTTHLLQVGGDSGAEFSNGIIDEFGFRKGLLLVAAERTSLKNLNAGKSWPFT